ncbi:hypothetical protein CFC21_090010, partial [Triticum aestivum]
MVYGGEEALRRQYSIGDEIGHGRFGTVRRCHSNATGEALALKTTPKAPLRDALDLALAEQEPKLHLLASSPPCSPHLVALHAAFDDADAVHLVVDLCTGGDLLSLLSARGGRLPEREAAGLAVQLASALAACHRRGVAHRDVKPDNLLFDAATGALKLADFGSAEWFGDGRRMSGIVGTPYYVAPEVVAGREYGEKVDVWSAGVVLYMMLSGAVPFYGAGRPGDLRGRAPRQRPLPAARLRRRLPRGQGPDAPHALQGRLPQVLRRTSPEASVDRELRRGCGGGL